MLTPDETRKIKAILKPAKAKPITRWPKELPHLTPKHFFKNTWTGDDVASALRTLADTQYAIYQVEQADVLKAIETIDKHLPVCSTPRCAVGNLMAAFGRDPRFDAWHRSGLSRQISAKEGPMYKFLSKFMDELEKEFHLEPGERNPHTYNETYKRRKRSLMGLSDLFEYDIGYASSDPDDEDSTKRGCAKAWQRTLEHFGYTEAA